MADDSWGGAETSDVCDYSTQMSSGEFLPHMNTSGGSSLYLDSSMSSGEFLPPYASSPYGEPSTRRISDGSPSIMAMNTSAELESSFCPESYLSRSGNLFLPAFASTPIRMQPSPMDTFTYEDSSGYNADAYFMGGGLEGSGGRRRTPEEMCPVAGPQDTFSYEDSSGYNEDAYFMGGGLEGSGGGRRTPPFVPETMRPVARQLFDDCGGGRQTPPSVPQPRRRRARRPPRPEGVPLLPEWYPPERPLPAWMLEMSSLYTDGSETSHEGDVAGGWNYSSEHELRPYSFVSQPGLHHTRSNNISGSWDSVAPEQQSSCDDESGKWNYSSDVSGYQPYSFESQPSGYQPYSFESQPDYDESVECPSPFYYDSGEMEHEEYDEGNDSDQEFIRNASELIDFSF